MDGNRPMVETLAQDISPLDREVQHDCSDCHQRTNAQLGRSCCQNGPLRDLCEGFEMSVTSVVEVATTPLERSEERPMGWSAAKTIQIFQVGRHGFVKGFQICWKLRWICGISPFVCMMAANSLRIVGAGDSLQHMR